MSASQPGIDGPFAIIPGPYLDVLLILHEKLKNVKDTWAVGGQLGESLRAVRNKPASVEILTSEKGIEHIFQALTEYSPTVPTTKTEKLSRDALIEGKAFPTYLRSLYSEFQVRNIKVRIFGNLQIKINDWDWGDPIEFSPESTIVVGKRINVVPLAIKLELYTLLGWTDRVEKIKKVLARRKPRL